MSYRHKPGNDRFDALYIKRRPQTRSKPSTRTRTHDDRLLGNMRTRKIDTRRERRRIRAICAMQTRS